MIQRIRSALSQIGTAPLRVKVVVILALAYLASPIDLIPDFIPVLGQLDDILLAAVVVKYVKKHVPEFRI